MDFVLDPRFIAGVLIGWYLSEQRPRQCSVCGSGTAAIGFDSDVPLTAGQRRMAGINHVIGDGAFLAQQRVKERIANEAALAFDSMPGMPRPQEDDDVIDVGPSSRRYSDR